MKKIPFLKKHFFYFSLILTGLTVFMFASFWTEWTEYPANPVLDPAAGVRAYYPSVIYNQDQFNGHGTAAYYKMWFASPDSGAGGIAFAFSDDGDNWTEYNNSLPLAGLQAGANHPVILYDPDGFGAGVFYKIWYWHPAVSYTLIDTIRYAESTDGITWVNDQPIQQHASDQNLQLVDGVPGSYFFHLYGPGSLVYNPSAANVGSGTPNDKSDDQPMTYRYVMYYDTSGEGSSPNGSVEQEALAYSTDGIYWIRFGDEPVLLPSGNASDWDGMYSFRSSVVKIGSTFHMWFAGANGDDSIGTYYAHGIGHAVSSDGLNWTKDPDNPVFHVTDGVGWRDVRSYTPCVIYDAGGFSGHGESCGLKMWFTGRTGSNYTIGYASRCDGPPVAEFQCVSEGKAGEELCFNGSASSDPDGDDIIEYAWDLSAKPVGSTAKMSPGNRAKSCFTPDVPGTYTVNLRVASAPGGEQVWSEGATCDVTVEDQLPLAEFECVPEGNVGEEICFNGSASSDPDGDDIVEYAWRLAAKPTGSSAEMPPNNDVQSCFIPDKAGTYTVALKVASENAGGEKSWSEETTCEVTVPDRPPEAKFACTAAGKVGEKLCFNGSASSDPDGGDIVEYAWGLSAKPPGSSAVMSPANAAQSCFTPDKAGTYTVTLKVASGNAGGGKLWSGETSCEVTTLDRPPVAVFDCISKGNVGEKLCFHAGASYDPDGENIVEYAWTLSKSPPGSSARMSVQNAVRSCFTPDMDGVYIVSLTAASLNLFGETVRSESVLCKVSIQDRAPVAVFNCFPSGKVGENICFNGSASFDPDGTAISGFSWGLSSKPPGSTAELSPQNLPESCFSPDVEGIYTVSLIVESKNSAGQTVRSLKKECPVHIQGYAYCLCPVVALHVERLEDRMWHKRYRIEKLTWTTDCTTPCCDTAKFRIYKMVNGNWEILSEVDGHIRAFEQRDVGEWNEYKVVPLLPDNSECVGRVELPAKNAGNIIKEER